MRKDAKSIERINMGYLHIENLYKNQDIFLFKKCYALEKIHGTSAHISWNNDTIRFFSGGEKHDRFVSLFDKEKLIGTLIDLDIPQPAIIYGEAYGGKQQGMKETYGTNLKFVAFDVKVGDVWLSVPQAEYFVKNLNIEFVHYAKIPALLPAIDTQRNRPSIQAKRNDMGDNKIREGVVLRPIMEVTKNNGERIIVKHKNELFKETRKKRVVTDKDKLEILTKAKEIAEEWVVPMRLSHILNKIPNADITKTGDVIHAMIEDVYRESKGEVEWSKDVARAVGKQTAIMFKERIKKIV